MVLTAKQRKELHIAIAEYLRSNGFEAASRAVAEETGAELASTEPDGAGDVLEKKWTAVVRLQKRSMELEAQVAKLNGKGQRKKHLTTNRQTRTHINTRTHANTRTHTLSLSLSFIHTRTHTH